MNKICPDCDGRTIRIFSKFNEAKDRWEWWKGCNDEYLVGCAWESRDVDEEKLHPEYFKRSETSPAKISSRNTLIYQ